MPETKPTHTLGSDWSFDKITQEVTDEHGDMVAIIQWLSSPEIGGIFAAAPDMLEALECSEDCRIAGGYTIFWNSMREKWQPRFQELFEGRELREIDDLFELDIALTSRALAKAKGEADG